MGGNSLQQRGVDLPVEGGPDIGQLIPGASRRANLIGPFSRGADLSDSRHRGQLSSFTGQLIPVLVRILRLDVAGANRDLLVLAGVNEADVHLAGLCTAMHLDLLTSYRAEKEQAGRIAGAIRARA